MSVGERERQRQRQRDRDRDRETERERVMSDRIFLFKKQSRVWSQC